MNGRTTEGQDQALSPLPYDLAGWRDGKSKFCDLRLSAPTGSRSVRALIPAR